MLECSKFINQNSDQEVKWTHTTGQELMKLIPLRVPENWPEQAADIAVITLTRNAPPDLPRYSLYGRADEVGRAAVLTGFGLTGHGSAGEDDEFDGNPTLRAGLNRIEAVDDELRGAPFLVADFDNGLPENNSLNLLGVPSDLGFGGDEVGFAGGDSGGPMFIGGAIDGVNAFSAQPVAGDVNKMLDSSWGEAIFFTRVSHYRSFILVATGGSAVFVPEPSTIALLIVGALGISHLAKNSC